MPSRFFDVIENYSEQQIIELIREVEKILETEDNLIYIPKGKTMVVGDLHGDLETLNKIITTFFTKKFKTLLFLGDFVDRGAKQVEVVNVLFYYKRLIPNRLILIRGNHEDPIINRQYGFYDEVRVKFNDHKKLFRLYNFAFSRLPLAAITWNKVFCVHGGIPEGLDHLEDINLLPNDQKSISHPIVKQLVWNDPKERVKEFKKSIRGPGVKKFGREAIKEFLEKNEVKYIIRSHEMFKNGYKVYFDEKLVSIFSSKSYSRRVSTVVGVIDKKDKIVVMPI